MTTKIGSILNYLPDKLEKRQFVMLDSIRFCYSIISTNWITLQKELKLHSDYKNNHYNIPQLYSLLWSIIDNIHRLVKIHTNLGIVSQKMFFDKLKFVKDYRDTYQHLYERFDQAILDFDFPIFGILTWNYINKETKKVEVFITSSGIIRADTKFDTDITKFDDKKDIDNIMLDSILRRKIDGESQFIKSKLDVSQLIMDLNDCVANLEGDLKNKFDSLGLEQKNWDSIKDMQLRLKS